MDRWERLALWLTFALVLILFLMGVGLVRIWVGPAIG
jgi:hypothetical protein